MKNLYLRVLTYSVRLYRQIVCPAKMLLSHVAISPSSVQLLVRRNYNDAKGMFRWRRAHALFGMTCLIAIVSGILLGGEGTSLAYRTDSVPIVNPSSVPVLAVELPVITELRKNQILVSSAAELISELKQVNLWNIEDLESMPNILVSRFPADLAAATVPDKKKAFIISMLSAAMVVLDEIRLERQQLTNILDELGGNPSELIFSKTHPSWMEALGANNINFIESITKKYRTENAAELLSRVDILPLSLIVAQGAIESSWGSSRFAIQANNLFGMWTWSKKGLVPLRRDPGKTHRIALYDSIVDSVRAYVLTINRVSAYGDLREIRQQTLDSYSLSEGLIRYSERKELYVEDVKRIIEVNNLKSYDGISFSAT